MTETPLIQYVSTPISPERCFSDITGQKVLNGCKFLRVVWHPSWVEEWKLPELEDVRRKHIETNGKCWPILPGINEDGEVA